MAFASSFRIGLLPLMMPMASAILFPISFHDLFNIVANDSFATPA